jgi:YVTN family beta-propeller protein
VVIGIARNSPGRNQASPSRAVGRLVACAAAIALGASVGYGQSLEKTLYLPDSLSGVIGPSCIVYSPSGNKAYVSGGLRDGYPRAGADCWVVVIDGTTDQRVKRIAVPTAVSALCYDSTDNKVYAVNYLDSVVSVIDASSDSVVAEVQLPCDPNFGLCWNRARNKIYLELNTDSAVAVIDCSSDSVIKTVQAVSRASMLVCAPEYDRVYCGGEDMPEVAVVDCSTDTICARFALTSYPTAICYDTSGGRVFVATTREVVSIDASSDTIIATGDIGQTVFSLGYHSSRNRLYCAVSPESVYVLDASTLEQVARLHAPGTWTKSLLCDARGDRLYCASDDAGVLDVVDCATNSITAVLSVGERPVALCSNSRDGKVYCVSYGSDDVAVVAGDSVAARVAVGSQPRAFCYNKVRNKVYCANYSNGLVSVIDGVTNQVLANVRVGYRVYDLCYAPEADKVYCPSWLEGRVTVIDCATDSVIARVWVDTLPMFISYSPVQNRMYVANIVWPDTRLFAIDCATDSVCSIVDLPSRPSAQCYHKAENKLYCGMEAMGRNYSVHVFACGPDSLLDTVPGTSEECYAIFSSSLYNKVYCGNFLRGTVAVVDASADTILRVIDLPGNLRLVNAACFDPSRRNLYLALASNPGTVLLLDAETDLVLDQIRGRDIDDLRYDGTTDMIFGSHDDTVDAVAILDCASNEYTMDIPVGRRPGPVLWNPVSNRAYVGNRLSGSVSIIRSGGGGVAEAPYLHARAEMLASVIRGALYLPQASGSGRGTSAVLFNVAGRDVLDLKPGANDVSRLTPGVYFVGEGLGNMGQGLGRIRKVIITR